MHYRPLWSSPNGGNVTEEYRRWRCTLSLIKHFPRSLLYSSEWSSHGVCLLIHSGWRVGSSSVDPHSQWAWHAGSLTLVNQGVWKWASFSEWGTELKAMCTDSENQDKVKTHNTTLLLWPENNVWCFWQGECKFNLWESATMLFDGTCRQCLFFVCRWLYCIFLRLSAFVTGSEYECVYCIA